MSKKEKFYVVHSHYDKDGRKSRSVTPVRGEVFTYAGHTFGLYHDTKEGLWKLIDILTGKQLASGAKKEFTRSRIMVPQVFYDYEVKTQTKDYEGLMSELMALIEKYLRDNPPNPVNVGAAAAVAPVTMPTLIDPQEDALEELRKCFYKDMGLTVDPIDYGAMEKLGRKGGLF